MPPRRQPGLGAMRQIRTELKDATRERKDVDQRIKRLRAAEAALNGGRSPSAQMLNRAQLRGYLIENPGSRSLDIADTLGVPPGSVRTLLSTMKKDGETTNQHQRWYPTKGTS